MSSFNFNEMLDALNLKENEYTVFMVTWNLENGDDMIYHIYKTFETTDMRSGIHRKCMIFDQNRTVVYEEFSNWMGINYSYDEPWLRFFNLLFNMSFYDYWKAADMYFARDSEEMEIMLTNRVKELLAFALLE